MEYVSFALLPITREMRVNKAQSRIFEGLNEKQKEFLDFVLSKYIETGVGELSQDKLPGLLELKYHTINDATEVLGGIAKTRELFVGFQEYLYAPIVA